MTDHEMKLPPQNLEAEAAVLGGMLLSPEAVDTAMEMLKPANFYKMAHAKIFRAIKDMVNDGEPVDTLTLVNKLSNTGELEKVGGAYFLTGLADAIPTATNLTYYADIVREKAEARRTIYVCHEAIESLFSGDATAEQAHGKILELADNIDPGGFAHISQGAEEALVRLERIKRDGVIPGISTRFIDLDKKIGGLEKKTLVILAARPSMGKTSLAMSIAINIAEQGEPVGVFSIETTNASLASRQLLQAREMGDESKIEEGRITDEAMEAARKESARLKELPIYIDDAGVQGIDQIRSRARRLKTKHGLSVLFIDFLQLLSGSKAENRNLEMGIYTAGLKAIAKDLDIAIVALSQLSRKCEDRENKRPLMADLRDGGTIEQDANMIIFIYRPEVYGYKEELGGQYAGRDNTGLAEILIAKNKDGPTGMVLMTFIADHIEFKNYAGLPDGWPEDM